MVFHQFADLALVGLTLILAFPQSLGRCDFCRIGWATRSARWWTPWPCTFITSLSFSFLPGMSNCRFFQCNLDYFCGGFDIGVSLHACGLATDLVLAKCLSAPAGPNGPAGPSGPASFVCCPCCYGAVRENHVVTYPKSGAFRKLGLSFKVTQHTQHCKFISKSLREFRLLLLLAASASFTQPFREKCALHSTSLLRAMCFNHELLF